MKPLRLSRQCITALSTQSGYATLASLTTRRWLPSALRPRFRGVMLPCNAGDSIRFEAGHLRSRRTVAASTCLHGRFLSIGLHLPAPLFFPRLHHPRRLLGCTEDKANLTHTDTDDAASKARHRTLTLPRVISVLGTPDTCSMTSACSSVPRRQTHPTHAVSQTLTNLRSY